MIHFQKVRDLKTAGGRFVSNSELICSLFKSMPELKHFKFVKNQEYDDNNYFDSVNLTEVNGYACRYGEYDEDEVQNSTLPKIEKIDAIENAVSHISEDYDFSDNDIEIIREDYEDHKEKISDYYNAERKYFAAYLSGKTLPNSFFVKNDPKWAVYYALDHGRFDPKTEFKIFAKNGEMYYALEYAKHVVKGRLSDELENFFILTADEEDKKELALYLEFVNGEKKTQEHVAALSKVHQD